jgi:hypothetical protein
MLIGLAFATISCNSPAEDKFRNIIIADVIIGRVHSGNPKQAKTIDKK